MIRLILFSFMISCISLLAQDALNTASDHVQGQEFLISEVNWSPLYDAAGEWCPPPQFPSLPTATYFQATAWVGDTLYVHAPTTTGASSTTIYKYTYDGSWSSGVPLPLALTGGSLTECNGKLYYIGGGTTTITTGSTNAFSYDPATGNWTAIAPLPVPLSAHGAVCWGDSVIFVVGGPYTGSATNLAVHYYRVATNTWGTIPASLPAGQGRRTFAIGLASGNKIIVSAGFNTAYLKSTWVGTIGSNATQITWTAAPDVPTGYVGLSRPGGDALDKYFFIVGGERSGGGYHDTSYVFDADLGAWIDIIQPKPFPMSNIFHGVTAKAFNDSIKIFVPGGYTGTASAEFDVVACGDLLVIPVELVSFSASVNERDVTLNWKTSTEKNNLGFEIERKTGNTFAKIGFVPGNGTTTEPRSYLFTDVGLNSGLYTYRLKQIDYDGTTAFSKEVTVEITVPSVYSLQQNYPNPFNPSTSINFSLAADSKVTLTVYNVLGQLVSKLVDGNLSAGFHEVDFNASGFNSGVYFYQIDAQGQNGAKFTSVKKMILTK